VPFIEWVGISMAGRRRGSWRGARAQRAARAEPELRARRAPQEIPISIPALGGGAY